MPKVDFHFQLQIFLLLLLVLPWTSSSIPILVLDHLNVILFCGRAKEQNMNKLSKLLFIVSRTLKGKGNIMYTNMM
jgi:hypothetical protein